jgi:hypothetical protein
MTITRKIAAAAVAAAAIVAPGAAQAQPADGHAPLARAAAAQDLRSPDARDAARTSSLAGTTSPKQDLRSPDARDAAIPRRRAIDAPGATAVDSQSRPGPAPVSAPASDGDGVDWEPIGIGLIGALLGIGGLGALAVRRTRRVRVPA